jgi:K+-sensing histidine kinase KdpD
MELRSVMRLNKPVNPALVNAISLMILLLIGWLDYITGYEFGFFIFYFIPVAIAAWLCGKRSGLTMAFASALCWYLSDKYTHHPYSQAFFIYWEMFMRLISFLTTSLTVSRIREMLLNEERLNAELMVALQEVRSLKSRITDPATFDSASGS